MNISPLTVSNLNQFGWDIIRVSDVLSTKATDVEIIALALETNRIIITFDLDFTTLVTLSGKTGPSVITLRTEQAIPVIVTQSIISVVKQLELQLVKGLLVSVDDQKIRYRELPVELG